MTVGNLIDQAKKLSPAEQAELLDALIVMVGPEGADVALTPAQREDLRRRMEESRSGNAEWIDGDEAFAQLRKRD
jgi:putative addiction module component (TIGR02574 family)